MINLTIFNTDADLGGAGREAYTLLKNVQDDDLRAKLYVKYSAVCDEDVIIMRTGLLRSKCQEFLDRFFVRRGYPDMFRFTTMELAGDPWIRRTDIFQLYNLHGEYFSLPSLPWIVKRRPVVWLMPDLWAVTGHCAYAYGCEKWLTGCGGCPRLNEYPSLKRDTARWWFEKKRNTYRKCNITVVTPSRWLRGIVKRSPLLGHCNVVTIPTGIDLDTFRPVDKKEARSRLEIPAASCVLLLSAANLSSPRKFGKSFAAVLEEIVAKGPGNLLLLLAGGGKPDLPGSVMRRARFLGKVAREADMAVAYSAADVFAFPTRADNLPKAPIESLACGTPCVASNVGGVPEIIQHGRNGYLVEPDDGRAFAGAVLKLLHDEDLRQYLGARCRNSVIDTHDIKEQVGAFRRLYASLLDQLEPPTPVPQTTEKAIIATGRYAARSAV